MPADGVADGEMNAGSYLQGSVYDQTEHAGTRHEQGRKDGKHRVDRKHLKVGL